MTGNRLMMAIATQIGDPKIEDLSVTFGAVATDLYTGQEDLAAQWVDDDRHPCVERPAGPLCSKRHEDRWLIDGGVVNPVPDIAAPAHSALTSLSLST